MSGGEGYIDFRMGEFIAWCAYRLGGNGAVVVEENMTTCVSAGDEDGEMEEAEDAPIKLQPKAERSHLIVWQVTQDWALASDPSRPDLPFLSNHGGVEVGGAPLRV